MSAVETRFCGHCGGRLVPTTSRGGQRRWVCENRREADHL